MYTHNLKCFLLFGLNLGLKTYRSGINCCFFKQELDSIANFHYAYNIQGVPHQTASMGLNYELATNQKI